MIWIKKINEYVRGHFLLVLTGTAVLGAFFANASQVMKKIVLFRVPHTPWQFDVPTLALFFMMFASSVNCRVQDFRHLAKTPRSFLMGLLQFYMVLPILAWAGAQLGGLLLPSDIGPQIGCGIALVALMPCAAISNLWVKFVRGNTALLLVFLTLTTALNIVVTPVLLTAILGVSKGEINVPKELMVGNLIMGVLFPLVTGMFLRQFFEKHVQRHADVISLFGILGLHIAFFANSGNAIPILSRMSFQNLFIVIGLTVGLNAVSSAVAYLMGRQAKLPYEDLATLSVSGGMRSNGIALVVGMKTFPALPLVTVPAAIYSFCQHIIAGQVKKVLDRRAEAIGAHGKHSDAPVRAPAIDAPATGSRLPLNLVKKPEGKRESV